MIYIVIVIMAILFTYIFLELHKEKKRNRILQSFMAGLIKSVSDYISKTDASDMSTASDLINTYSKKFPIPYNEVLKNINREFEKDFWQKPYWKWVKNDRSLFYDDKYANDGFNMIYWDFFDNALAEINKAREKEAESKAESNKGKSHESQSYC